MTPLPTRGLLLAFLTAAATAAPVSIPGTGLSMTLPSGFVTMPPDVLKLKYSRGMPPSTVYSTPGPHWDVNIAFDLRKVELPDGGLAPVQAALERSVVGVPGFRWVSHGIRKVSGRDWIVMQFWVDGLDTPIYNDLRATPVAGGVLLVTANATKAQYPKYASVLTAALDSLR